MIAPKACYSSLALPTRENCDSATLSVAVSRMSTTLGCSGMNGRDRCRHCRMQKARCKATLRDNTFQIAPDGRPQGGCRATTRDRPYYATLLPGDHRGYTCYPDRVPLLGYAAACQGKSSMVLGQWLLQ